MIHIPYKILTSICLEHYHEPTYKAFLQHKVLIKHVTTLRIDDLNKYNR